MTKIYTFKNRFLTLWRAHNLKQRMRNDFSCSNVLNVYVHQNALSFATYTNQMYDVQFENI